MKLNKYKLEASWNNYGMKGRNYHTEIVICPIHPLNTGILTDLYEEKLRQEDVLRDEDPYININAEFIEEVEFEDV